MRVRAMVTAITLLVAVGVVLPPPIALAQWRRGRTIGGPGEFGGGYGRELQSPYGGGYGYGGGQSGGYPSAGSGVPPRGYDGGYAAPGYGGYPGPGYSPPPYQQPYAYPPPGQNPQQDAANQRQCQQWAIAQSGYSPNAPTQGAQEASASRSTMAGGRSVLRGGARGAAMGAATGAIAGNTSEGAEIGAATGAMMGGFKRRDQRQAEMQGQAQQVQLQSQQSAAYSRALEACLTGQGYTVR